MEDRAVVGQVRRTARRPSPSSRPGTQAPPGPRTSLAAAPGRDGPPPRPEAASAGRRRARLHRPRLGQDQADQQRLLLARRALSGGHGLGSVDARPRSLRCGPLSVRPAARSSLRESRRSLRYSSSTCTAGMAATRASISPVHGDFGPGKASSSPGLHRYGPGGPPTPASRAAAMATAASAMWASRLRQPGRIRRGDPPAAGCARA